MLRYILVIDSVLSWHLTAKLKSFSLNILHFIRSLENKERNRERNHEYHSVVDRANIFASTRQIFCIYTTNFNECLSEKGLQRFKFIAECRFCSRGQIIIPACNIDYGVQLLETSGKSFITKAGYFHFDHFKLY